MGLAASQASLLTLTSRLSDLEYRSELVSNEKMALARKSQEASDKYIETLDAQTIKVVDPDTNTKVTATAAKLINYGAISKSSKQRMLKATSGEVIVSQDVANAYEASKNVSKNIYCNSSSDVSKALQTQITTAGVPVVYNQDTCDTAAEALYLAYFQQIISNITNKSVGDNQRQYSYNGEAYSKLFSDSPDQDGYYSAIYEVANYFTQQKISKMSYAELIQAEATTGLETTENATDLGSGLESFMNSFGYTTNTSASNYDSGAESWYEEVFDQMQSCGYDVVSDSNLNDPDWLYEQLSAGNIYLSEQVTTDGKKDWGEVSWNSGDNEITTVDNTKGQALAEAEYEAATTEISAKDERYDTQLKNIDTEHSAVQNTIESIKKVIDKSIERNFKMFDA